MAREPAAQKSPGKQAQRLQRVVRPQGRAAQAVGGHARDQAGLGGLQHVEADKEHQHGRAQQPQRGRTARQRQRPQPGLHQQHQHDGQQQGRAQLALALHREQAPQGGK